MFRINLIQTIKEKINPWNHYKNKENSWGTFNNLWINTHNQRIFTKRQIKPTNDY